MEDIRIIKNKNELEGTCYMEILPGAYKNQCWNDGSLFFEEEVFGYIEPIIERHVPNYDHYAFTEITKEQWLEIANDLLSLASLLASVKSVEDLEGKVGFIFKRSKERFSIDFTANKTSLSHVAEEFSSWGRAKVIEHGSITILGI